jgi:hypothetical protein
MDYSNFSVSFPVALVTVVMGVVLGVVTLILARRRKHPVALIVGVSSALLIAVWVLANGMVETARTNEMLYVADDIAVPERFEPGKAEDFRGGRTVRATAFLPCMAVTAPCPSIHRQWSAPEGLEVTREDLEKIISDSGWQDKLVIDEEHCRLTYTNSNVIGCYAKGVLGDFDSQLRISQTSGDVWRLALMMEPTR